MAKRIKNNTGATITVLGQEIAAAAYYTLDQFDEKKAINALDALIDAGTIVINDGAVDLSADLGKALIGNANSYFQNLTLSDGTNPYLQITSGTYQVASRCVFPGSTVATLNKILATCSLGGGTAMSIRIYDLTNSLVIAEATGITSATAVIVDLGALSNIPTAQAIFEVQVLASGPGPKARCSSVLLRS